MTTPQRQASPDPTVGAGPDDQLAGMVAYWAPALMRGLDSAIAMSRQGDGLTERLDNLYRQLIGDALREAFFRGGAWGMAVSTTRYLLVDKETLAKMKEDGTFDD